MWRQFVRLVSSRDGSVAPIVALSLTGMVAIGGIAFDYSRMASMDTELQNAADQAALAAATQLDRVPANEETGEEGARARALKAASASDPKGRQPWASCSRASRPSPNASGWRPSSATTP